MARLWLLLVPIFAQHIFGSSVPRSDILTRRPVAPFVLTTTAAAAVPVDCQSGRTCRRWYLESTCDDGLAVVEGDFKEATTKSIQV